MSSFVSQSISAAAPKTLFKFISAAAPKTMFNSSGYSFALEGDMESQQGDQMGVAGIRENYNYNYNFSETINNTNLVEIDRSVSDNASDQPPPGMNKKARKYNRHTPRQIHELETVCIHPNENQRSKISHRLNLNPQQVKFWFQNRRNQMKTHQERQKNSLLRKENDRLRLLNMSLKDAMKNPLCSNCGGSASMPEISPEEQRLRLENEHIKKELNRLSKSKGKVTGQPTSSLDLDVNIGSSNMTFPLAPVDLFGPSQITQLIPQATNNSTLETSAYFELALAGMDELLKMAQLEEPIWIRGSYGGRLVLNQEEYSRSFTPCIGMKPNGFVTEASKETGVVLINSLELVDTLMESNKWAEMFAGVIAREPTTDVISDGMGGTRNGALYLMHAELQVVSPLVPVREVNFLRFCKQHGEGLWAVVDVSINTIRGSNSACRRLPSGCIVQDMPNGYSRVTWVEHAEYKESVIHPLYRSMIASSIGFGAQRWISTLQRQCESLVMLMSSDMDLTAGISPGGRRSMLKLAQRMTNNFFAGVCASTVHSWKKLRTERVNDMDIRLMTRKSMNDPGEPSGVVVSAATSVWLPVAPQRLFDFLRNENMRGEWDILSNGAPMLEMDRIAKAHDAGNSVSLLHAGTMDLSQSNVVIFQNTSSDASGSVMIYAPVDVPVMQAVMDGADSAYVALLPSGFAVVPDGPEGHGSLLTVGFQILVNCMPTAKLTVESVETVNKLVLSTVQKIKGHRGTV